jgi:SAM-dependent methyltransferase
MVHHRECPLCRSENISFNFSCADHFVSKEVFQIYKCKECGFGFTQDYPEESKIGRYYESEDYISHSDTSRGLSNKLYRMVRNIMLRRKRGIVRKVTRLAEGSILDIGSGTGYFALTMTKAGWKVKGIEINDKARNFSSSQFGIDVSGPDKINDLKSEIFDCITLWHVLEHFHDPLKYVAEIYRLLKPDGVCVIALPNNDSYDAKYYGSFWAAYDVPRHLWHFNPDSFRIFSEKTGFKQGPMKTLPMDVFYISQLSEKYKGSSLAFLRGIFKAVVFTFLSAFNKKKSSSLIYILRK